MNRETYPSSQSPLKGDVSGAAGATTVTVTGLQRTPISVNVPSNGNVLTFVSSTKMWTPSGNSFNNESIQVNGVAVSDDYDVGVNLVLGISSSPMFVNGV